MDRSNAALSAELLDAAVELLGRAGRGGVVRVQGASMHPTFRQAQRLAIDFAPGALRRGDVLLFRLGEILVVHRLVDWQRRTGRRRLRTRGDGTIVLDPWLDEDRVVGRVVALEDDQGWRDLRVGRARCYAWTIACHDLFWAGLGAVAVKSLGRSGKAWRMRLGRLDRLFLGGVHALFFPLSHPRRPAPRWVDGAEVAAENR